MKLSQASIFAAGLIGVLPFAVQADTKLNPVAYLAEDVGSATFGRPEAQCKYYTGSAIRRDDMNYAGRDVISGAGKEKIEGLNCVLRWMAECSAGPGRDYNGKQKHSTSDNSDFCMYSRFAGLAADLSGRKPGTYNSSEFKNTYHRFVLDSQCQPVEKADFAEGEICGEIEVAEVTTPISLVWDSTSVAHPQWSAAQFAFNPYEKAATYSWRGSSSMPLLVYDPEHTGAVRDGSQLFGNWTFGGRQTALLSSHGGSRGGHAGPWDNGYQALAVLDRNSDGKISGDELGDLALWFDHDRDANSQAGEVVTLDSVGVTAVFYTPDARQKPGLDIRATQGYEREVEGVRRIGSSIDWFAERAPYEWAAIIREIDRLGRLNQPLPPAQSHPPEPANQGAMQLQSSPLSGAWIWELAGEQSDSQPAVPRGVLTLSAGADGALSGHSFVERPIRKRDAKNAEHSVISALGLAGRVLPGKAAIRAEFATAQVPPTQNQVQLSADGKSLSGVSIVGGQRSGAAGTSQVIYRWTARRADRR